MVNMMGSRAFVAMSTAMIVVLSGAARSAERVSGFEYTARIQDEIVSPILERELGRELVRYYDPARPIIKRSCNDIELLFTFDYGKVPRDEIIVDPPYVIIALDPRTLAVQSVSTRPSYVIGPPARCGVEVTPPTASP